jgi:hypothetical protein
MDLADANIPYLEDLHKILLCLFKLPLETSMLVWTWTKNKDCFSFVLAYMWDKSRIDKFSSPFYIVYMWDKSHINKIGRQGSTLVRRERGALTPNLINVGH